MKNGSFKLIHYCIKAYTARFAVMIACLLTAGIAEAAGIVSLLPLIQIGLHTSAVPSHASLFLERTLSLVHLTPSLGVLLLIVVVGIVAKNIFVLLAMRQVGYTVSFVMTDFRLMLVRSLLKARWNYFVSQPTGNFVNSMGTETIRAATAYHSSALMIANSIQVVIYALLTLAVSWQVTLVAITVGGSLFFLLNYYIKKSRQAGVAQTALQKSIAGRLVDLLHGMKPIKAMALEKRMQVILEAETRELDLFTRRDIWASETLKVFSEPVLTCLIALFLYLAITFGKQEFSSLLVMAFLFQRLLTRINQVQQNYQASAAGESAFWSLQISVGEAERETEQHNGKNVPPSLEQGICFESVNFSFGERAILKNASFEIMAKRITAIIGPSGAGKTTIADLVTGLFLPDNGKILVDGLELSSFDMEKWRNLIGYVPQEMFLFHDTIEKNLSFGQEEITAADIELALRGAGAWDFVSEQEAGIQAVVGERGTRLSGGQRQRLAIARALVRKPKVLILDEVTTSLDPSTEKAICATIRALREKTTIIIISHQPAIIDIADSVYRLESGVITPKNHN